MTLLERLCYENVVLEKDGFSQFRIYSSQSSYYLWGSHKTNSGNAYSIWSPIPTYYPDVCPSVYVYQPNPLVGYSQTINSYGLSHAMHTLKNGPNGEVQICHWRSDRWDSSITFNRIMLKVVMWLEAYELHLTTGRPISDFVTTMPER